MRTWSHLQAYQSIQGWFFSYLTLQKLNLYLAKLGSYFEFALFCNGFTLVPTAHATLDVWIVIYVYIFNWNICIGKSWDGPCVLYFTDWTLWRILDSNNDRNGFLCYVFLSRNLKELGVLWLWTKNLFNRKRGHERLVMKEP